METNKKGLPTSVESEVLSVQALIEQGLNEILNNIDRYFIARGEDLGGHGFDVLTETNKRAKLAIEKMKEIEV